MALTESLLIYCLIGLAVAFAVAVSSDHRSVAPRIFQSLSAILFWPLYLPILLTPTTPEKDTQADEAAAPEPPDDAWSARIAQVESELDAALDSLDGWAEQALAREQGRIAELKSAWRMQAARIREMDRLLAGADLSPYPPEAERAAPSRVAQKEQARRQNLARLREIRDQACDDLTAALASVRELASMIHLAKFTGAPVSQAEELVSQVAAAVEGLSEVAAWSRPT